MSERSFKGEAALLALREGEVFRGEGVLAVAKALFQSGVSYVGGYEGAPISHLIDVMNDAAEIRRDLGVHFENCTGEAAAAAMLAASIHYPLRGAVTWKSTVGTNVASDALANVASAGVIGGCLVIIGEDYGDGSSIMQERTHAFAMKSQMWLLDPKPNLPDIVAAVEAGFELSEATNTPVFLMLRIRACHLYGSFVAKDNQAARPAIDRPVWDYGKVVLPPSSFSQEVLKVENRWPAAVRHVAARQLNKVEEGTVSDAGIIVQGGLYNALIRALDLLGLVDATGKPAIPLYVMTVAYPLVPDEIIGFCEGKNAVLVIEEGQPNYVEQAIKALANDCKLRARFHGKDILPMAGEYGTETLMTGLLHFLEMGNPGGIDTGAAAERHRWRNEAVKQSRSALPSKLPPRFPGFCVGCPERPLFSALKMVQAELGETHVCGDIGCNLFSTLPPFNMGQHTVGYGLGFASSAGLAPNFTKRVVSIMGDGGFWHNGLSTGVAGAVFNGTDGVLVIVDNGYAAATGHHALPSSPRNDFGLSVGRSIEQAVRGVGASWVRTVDGYDIEAMRKTLVEALTTAQPGPKIIISRAECELQRQRRIKPEQAARMKDGRRVSRVRFGVDPDVCTGDHACIRLSGCPSLTLADNPDPLMDDPVAHIDDKCVGCGNCGRVSHEAGLCPSFYQVEAIDNPGRLERLRNRISSAVIGLLQGGGQ